MTRDILLQQLDTAWTLLSYHLETLTDEECLWRPAAVGMHVHRAADGAWRADWPERESYDIGPASIAWTTWHLVFWWSMAIDHAFGSATLQRSAVAWPGSAQGVRDSIASLHRRWRSEIEAMDDADLASPSRTRWPMKGRPFAHVVAWATVELAKNAAEIGYARFLYGASKRGAAGAGKRRPTARPRRGA